MDELDEFIRGSDLGVAVMNGGHYMGCEDTEHDVRYENSVRRR